MLHELFIANWYKEQLFDLSLYHLGAVQDAQKTIFVTSFTAKNRPFHKFCQQIIYAKYVIGCSLWTVNARNVALKLRSSQLDLPRRSLQDKSYP